MTGMAGQRARPGARLSRVFRIPVGPRLWSVPSRLPVGDEQLLLSQFDQRRFSPGCLALRHTRGGPLEMLPVGSPLLGIEPLLVAFPRFKLVGQFVERSNLHWP